MSVADQVAQIQKSMGEFQKIWNERVRPQLARDPRLPAQFVVDIANQLIDGVVNPVLQLQGGIAAAATGGSGIAQIVGGMTAAVLSQANDGIKDASVTAASTIVFLQDRVMAPLAKEALATIAAQGQRAMVRVVTTGTDTIDQVVLRMFQAGITATLALERIRNAAQGMILFRLGDVMMKTGKAIVGAAQALGAAIAAGVSTMYSIFKTLLFAAKVGLFAIAGYAGYRIYQEIKKPQPNPRRRRLR